MRNIGKSSLAMLNEVGVYTLDDIKRIGVVEVYVMVKMRYEKASLNLLYSLQSALMDISWLELPVEVKIELRNKVHEHLR